MNDDLEVGIAAGLDVPTAMVLADDRLPPQKGCGCGLFVLLAVALSWWLLG